MSTYLSHCWIWIAGWLACSVYGICIFCFVDAPSRLVHSLLIGIFEKRQARGLVFSIVLLLHSSGSFDKSYLQVWLLVFCSSELNYASLFACGLRSSQSHQVTPVDFRNSCCQPSGFNVWMALCNSRSTSQSTPGFALRKSDPTQPNSSMGSLQFCRLYLAAAESMPD